MAQLLRERGMEAFVIECLDIAESTQDELIRRRNLQFVVVGGGYAGIEALGELEDMSKYVTRYYHSIEPSDLRVVELHQHLSASHAGDHTI